ncbi:FxsA family protein [Chelativorans sp. YIM 93263]|uniref:FxsA family protein n=1 Tax=Chelativorans sp. YIM 93263 TaxID=2906648 RepID=UPI0023786259|nr:FxsA family protein [Chelativorans sp. YIM 93263]
MPFSIVPFLLLAIPLMEIAVFVLVGEQIGVLPTLALVLATAVAGSILLRIQGFGILSRVRRMLGQGQMPGRELVHGVMILLAGVLLLTPGFVTDTLGFLLFIPPLRDAAWRFLRNRVVIIGGASTPPGRKGRQERIIDLDSDDYTHTEDDDSPWRDHRG